MWQVKALPKINQFVVPLCHRKPKSMYWKKLVVNLDALTATCPWLNRLSP